MMKYLELDQFSVPVLWGLLNIVSSGIGKNPVESCCAKKLVLVPSSKEIFRRLVRHRLSQQKTGEFYGIKRDFTLDNAMQIDPVASFRLWNLGMPDFQNHSRF